MLKFFNYNNSLFFCLGLLVFSPLSSEIAINYLHLPLALPELFIIPFLFLLKEKFRTIRLNKTSCLKLFFLLILMFIFGVLEGRFSLPSLISNARVWLYLFLSYAMFLNENYITSDDIMYLSFGSLVAWALLSYLNFSIMGLDESTIAVYGVMLSIPVFISTAFSHGNKKVIVCGLLSIAIIMLLSGLRRAIFVFALSIFVYFVMIFIGNRKKIIAFLFFFLIISVLFIMILPILGEYIKSISYGLYHRVFIRTELLLTNGLSASNDTTRLSNFTYFLDNIQDYIIPHGLISHQTNMYKGVGLFNDFPLVQVSWIFSFPITVLILFRFLFVLERCMSKFYRYKHVDYLVCSSSLIVMFSLLFLEGTFLSFVYATPLTGVLLAKAVQLSKSVVKNNISL